MVINISTIDKKAKDIIAERTALLDEDRIREDLMGLIQDIKVVLKNNAPDKVNKIYEYAELLQKEFDLYDPCLAYEAGAVLGCCVLNGAESSPERDFTQYMLRIDYDPVTLKIRCDLNTMYLDMQALLGDKVGLLPDFIESYRQCNGIISNVIFEFFKMGYTLSHEHFYYNIGADHSADTEGSNNDA